MDWDIAAKGMKALRSVDSLLPKKDKIVLLSRQSSTPSLDFTLLANRLEQRLPGVEVSVCVTDPETVDKRAFLESLLTMSREVAQARVCVVDGYIPSVSIPTLDSQTRVIQLWHALGAIKKFGYQSLDTPAGRSNEEARKLRMHGNYDWIVAAGPGAVPAYSAAFGYPRSRILPLGMPRMDYLLDPSPESDFHRNAARILAQNPQLQTDRPLVMYLPTLRKGPQAQGWLTCEVEHLAQAFAPTDALLVVSGHPLDDGWDHALMERYGNIAFVPDEASCDLLGLADAAITDYSAIAFEARLLGVPTFFYVPDIEGYRASPGLNIDPERDFPDCSTAQPDRLASLVSTALQSGGQNSFAAFCGSYFHGVGAAGSTDRICDLVKATYNETNGGPKVDGAQLVSCGEREQQVLGADGAPPAPTASWAFQVYQALYPLLEDRVFAFGDTCVGAVFYQGFFSGMHELSLAALREDFDVLRGPIAQLAHEAGWTVCGENDAQQGFLQLMPERWAGSDPRDVFTLYPLDRVPHQSILRFKMLAEAARVRPGDLPAMERLKRYRSLDTGVVSRLFGPNHDAGVMGERTIQQRTVQQQALFPLRRLPFEGGFIQVPHDISNWASEPTPARRQITRIIQQDGLRSLEEIKRVCGQLDTRFFLVGGSLLGALRHKGYIPWDDDLDVGMLRADYRRFVAEGSQLLDADFFLQLPQTDSHIHFVYARLRHEGIDYLTLYNEHKDFDKSLWVDVFPFDAAPSNPVLARAQCMLARSFARASMGFKRRQEYAREDMHDGHPLLPEDARYLKCYAAVAPLFPVELCAAGYHLAAECLNPLLAGRKGTRYASFIPTYTVFEPGEVARMQQVDFEGHTMPVPVGADAFLTRQYGDYHQLPPIHERQTDHGFLRLELSDGTSLTA